MCRAVSMMAYLHMALREAGSELKINPRGETEYKEYAQAELKARQNRKETALRKTYVKHTRELKKAYNYLKQKKADRHLSSWHLSISVTIMRRRAMQARGLWTKDLMRGF